jgi:hypothetical protein
MDTDAPHPRSSNRGLYPEVRSISARVDDLGTSLAVLTEQVQTLIKSVGVLPTIAQLVDRHEQLREPRGLTLADHETRLRVLEAEDAATKRSRASAWTFERLVAVSASLAVVGALIVDVITRAH